MKCTTCVAYGATRALYHTNSTNKHKYHKPFNQFPHINQSRDVISILQFKREWIEHLPPTTLGIHPTQCARRERTLLFGKNTQLIRHHSFNSTHHSICEVLKLAIKPIINSCFFVIYQLYYYQGRYDYQRCNEWVE